ncbi:MAG: histidinol-phosphate transaminase [Pseudomonadota bacterium]
MSQRFWSDLTRELTPYVPGEQPKHSSLLKLNTNESPYAPSRSVLAAIKEVSGDDLLRYPDPGALPLRRAIAEFCALEPEQVFVGNGSDEVLSHVFMGLLKHNRPLLYPDICYSFYPVWCELHQITAERVPLRDDFRIAVDDYAAEAAAVILPNPNAPTGLALELGDIEALLQASPDRLIVIDEAYIDFGAQSAVPLINRYDNLLVVQTLSKSRALAGMRIGMAMGNPGLIEGLERIKDSFNSYPLDVVAQRAGLAAMADLAWYEETRNRVIASREALIAQLQSRGFEVLPSAANFVFARHKIWAGKAIFDGLRERGVIVRRWDKPRIENFLRISIGTEAQCARLLEELDQVLGSL